MDGVSRHKFLQVSAPMARTAHTARKEASATGKVGISRPEKSLSVRTPTISQADRPKASKHYSTATNVLREIKYYQTTLGFLIPKASLVRIIRGITKNVSKAPEKDSMRFTAAALNILHEAIENHLVYLLELSYMAARHAKRVTLYASDIRLIHRIRATGK